MKHKILIIDDSIVKLELTKTALTRNYDVIMSSSGKEALALLQEEMPDLILLDIEMPEMNGYEVIKTLKETDRTKNIPVIFLTSRSDEESELYGLSLGAIDYIITPFSTPLLLKRLELHLSLVEQKKELRSFNENLRELVNERTEKLRYALVAAEVADNEKATFLSNISHELRTPLNGIIGFSELAQSNDSLNKVKDYIGRIRENAGWLCDILINILDIPNIESANFKLDMISFELQEILTTCQSVITPMAEEKGLSLFCNIDPDSNVKILGDPARLRQVIMSLLSNAVKFTNEGTIELLVSVTDFDKDSITIDFEVNDSGIGISHDKIERIIEPFMQSDNSSTRRVGGIGLGLTIAKKIIECMGGKLKVESTIGVGSKFSFKLKFEFVNDKGDALTQKLAFSELEIPIFEGEILVCEDNSLNRQVISDHLARVGLNIVLTHNGKECVDIVTKRKENNEAPFSLILMDIHMPVMDGMEAATIITSLGVSTPIIALTANTMSGDTALYAIYGMSDTIGKPFTSHELWRVLAKYLPVVSYTTIDKRDHVEETKTQKLLKINFFKNNQTTYNDIISAIDNGDISLAHRLAHTLKSNAGQIGEERLRVSAALTESMLSDGMSKLSDEHKRSLKFELGAVLDALAPLLDTNPKNAAKPIDIIKTIEIFDKLKPLLENKDMRSMKFLDDISIIPGSEELVELIEACRFKQALISLESLREKME